MSKSLCSYLSPLQQPFQTIEAPYQLNFINKVKNSTFTTDLVRDENGDPIKVAIYDMFSQSITSPDCFLSSATVRLIVLNAELWEEKGENWSRSEINQSVLRAREGKGPILKGCNRIRLENGFGAFQDIVFNDNSSWTKSGFRLGVMVEGEGEEGYLNGERILEGVSERFLVKDRRGKASKKPGLLELKHEVQCLKNVENFHASLLQKNNIKTVEDFLKLYYNDELALRKILGIKSESDKGWKSMVEHAMQCAIEFHAKYNDLNNSSQCVYGVNISSQSLQRKIVLKLPSMIDNKTRTKAFKAAASFDSVSSVATDWESQLMTIIGQQMDAVEITRKIRKIIGPAEIVLWGPAKEEKKKGKKEDKEEDKESVFDVVQKHVASIWKIIRNDN